MSLEDNTKKRSFVLLLFACINEKVEKNLVELNEKKFRHFR